MHEDSSDDQPGFTRVDYHNDASEDIKVSFTLVCLVKTTPPELRCVSLSVDSSGLGAAENLFQTMFKCSDQSGGGISC